MENFNNILLEKARGYTVKETVTEYIIDEDGGKRAVKEKTQTKFIPPDITALKTYLDLAENVKEFDNLSDDELKREKERLLLELERKPKPKKP